MPKIKPLKKLVNKARDLRDSHKERHRPTGFGFALADSIDYLDAAHWNALPLTTRCFYHHGTCAFSNRRARTTCGSVTRSSFEDVHPWQPWLRKASQFPSRA